VTDIVSVPRTDIVHTEFLTQTESVVQEVKRTKDFNTGFAFIRLMKEMKRTLDDGTGIVMNGMAEIWKPEEHDGEDFEAAVVRETGLDEQTIKNHLKVQRNAPLVPEDFREEISLLPFRSKIKVAELVEEGYEMSDDDWLNIIQHPSSEEVGAISRQIKGVEPRTNWLEILEDENGVLYAHSIRGMFELGRWNSWDDTPEIQKGIKRLRNGKVKPKRKY
jgi:hypothetical protein